MADKGSLILVDEEVLTGATASVSLTGIDTTYDVYLAIINVIPTTDNIDFYVRVTKGGTPHSDSEYDVTALRMRADTASFNDDNWANQTYWGGWSACGNGEEGIHQSIWLYGFPDAQYSFINDDSLHVDSTINLNAIVGGYVHTVASASDGINFQLESADTFVVGSEFKLYGLKK